MAVLSAVAGTVATATDLVGVVKQQARSAKDAIDGPFDATIGDDGVQDGGRPLSADFHDAGEGASALLVQWPGSSRFYVHSFCEATSTHGTYRHTCAIESAKLKPYKAGESATGTYRARILMVDDEGLDRLRGEGYLDASDVTAKAGLDQLKDLLGNSLTDYSKPVAVKIRNPNAPCDSAPAGGGGASGQICLDDRIE